MIYWHCQPHHKSRALLVVTTLGMNCLILLAEYSLIQTMTLVVLSALLCRRGLTIHNTMPLAFSYHSNYWRCYQSQQIIQYQLRHGFVLGPLALLRLISDDSNRVSRTIVLYYWDVAAGHQSKACNWNQLGTILRYSQREKSQQDEHWLSS